MGESSVTKAALEVTGAGQPLAARALAERADELQGVPVRSVNGPEKGKQPGEGLAAARRRC